ncbi:MAG: hypothetical protein ACJ75F_10750 [Flavisolibacter sp.]|jgi:hypothetical protein
MEKKNIIYLVVLLVAFTGCYKRQKDFDYVKTPLDPHVYKTAKDYLIARADSATPGRVDTIFRWMKKAIEYSGIDWAEYEKPGRTYIFLHNSAIKVVTSGKVTGGFFFDYPVIAKDSSGNPIIKADGSDSVRIPQTWNEYPQQFVKNYLLSLIVEGEYTFENLGVPNTTAKTLLPAGTVAGNDSKLGYVVTKSEPSSEAGGNGSTIFFDKANGKGFDPEGKMNFRIINNSNSPLRINDKIDARTAGILATNGPIHVLDKTVHPFRYSYP